MGSHSWGYALAKLDAPRKPEDLLGVSPEPDLWDDEEDDVDAFNYYWDFYGLGFPEMDSIHSTTKVKFPTNGRIKRFLKEQSEGDGGGIPEKAWFLQRCHGHAKLEPHISAFRTTRTPSHGGQGGRDRCILQMISSVSFWYVWYFLEMSFDVF